MPGFLPFRTTYAAYFGRFPMSLRGDIDTRQARVRERVAGLFHTQIRSDGWDFIGEYG
jgi:hypothetical protein